MSRPFYFEQNVLCDSRIYEYQNWRNIFTRPCFFFLSFFFFFFFFAMHPTWIALPRPLFCRDIISHVFFRYNHQGTPDVNSIIYCSLISPSLSLCLCVFLSLSHSLNFGRLHTPYAHLPRDHLLPFLYATIHPVIYDGRKPHSKKRKLRNKVG